uniref:DNA damage-binding protein 1 n=1 Tax=Acrobeloides nanus TaxID=290746 RepID=A0A914DYF9_9BILA
MVTKNYIVSAQKPTVVNAAVFGFFRNAQEQDLVIARINRIELLLVTSEGLKPHREIPIFGRIGVIKSFRIPGENVDSLLILTVKYHLAIITFEENGDVRTRASGNIADRVGRPSETGIIACAHSSGLLAIRLYDGLLKIIQWEDGRELKCFNVRFEDHNVTDFAFLDTGEKSKPTIGYICQDNHGRHLKVCEIDIHEKELSSALWKQENIESEASLLIPISRPYSGLIIVGQESISYHKSGNQYTAIAPPLIHTAHFNCFGKIDTERFLLGDISGRLFMLLLVVEQNMDELWEVKDLKVELIGDISIPECLVYLDNSVVFVGSKFGDSQLIRLSSEPVDLETNSFVVVLDSYPNLGPIRDLVIINADGQNQVVTCSGGFKEGSLRIIRSGIGIEEHANVELSGVKALFTLRFLSELDNYLVASFIDETHLLKLNGEELEDTEINGFDVNAPTLWAGSISSEQILQITNKNVSIVSTNGVVVSWNCPSKISLCSVNAPTGQIALASSATIYYLEVVGDQLNLVAETVCEFEIACIDISPIHENDTSKLCAVGFWTEMSVALYSISPQFKRIVREKITGDVLPRSLLILTMEEIVYLLVALGDGTLYYYQIDMETGSLNGQKKVTIGTQPTMLRKFKSRDVANVFACSDRPAVIYSSNQKLSFSNVNLRLVTQMCPLNSEAYQDCLVMSDGEALIIGTIDDIQKLHIRTVPLGECVSRIAYQPETNTIAILTYRVESVLPGGIRSCRPSVSTQCTSRTANTYNPARFASKSIEQDEIQVHSVCILDANTFETLHVYELGQGENGMSLISTTLGDETTPLYTVGTGITSPDDIECKQGRLLIFQVLPGHETGKLRLIAEKEVKGALLSQASLQNKLICSINSSVRLFEWTSERELRLECSHFNFVYALYLKTKGDLVLVGDLMRSTCLLSYKQIESTFEEIARDYNTEWLTAVEIIDSDAFIGAENCYNLYTTEKDINAQTEEEKMRLQQIGMYYLGEMVNVFCRGSLMPNQIEMNSQYSNPILYGTSDGGLGVIIQLSDSLYNFVRELESRIAQETKNCMRIDHQQYRNFCTEKRNEPVSGFVDGDLVETIADMPRERVEQIIKGLTLPVDSSSSSRDKSATVEEVLKIVEDLTRMH